MFVFSLKHATLALQRRPHFGMHQSNLHVQPDYIRLQPGILAFAWPDQFQASQQTHKLDPDAFEIHSKPIKNFLFSLSFDINKIISLPVSSVNFRLISSSSLFLICTSAKLFARPVDRGHMCLLVYSLHGSLCYFSPGAVLLRPDWDRW